MHYRKDRYGNDLSILGFGCMRWQRSGGGIDLAEAEREVLAAVRGGVNYFDTAYVYPGSESALGTILAKNGLRDKVKITTKLPHYLIRSAEGMEKLFQEQLQRLQTDHVDYYLMHMLSDVDTWGRMKALGIDAWLEEKKAGGQIGQVGFSYHGNSEMFCKLVDAYDWDLCQIQYNYMDENAQAGRRGLLHAAQKGLPVIIMEPLRGGKLANKLPAEALSLFEEHAPKRTPVQWALRWLWDQPQVTVVLSGMNRLEQVQDNVQTASDVRVGELTEGDRQLLARVVAAINAKMKVGCTGCGYCMPCPKNVDIPGTFADYNRKYSEGRLSAFREHMMTTLFRKTQTSAGNCVGCGKCEKHCPQGIAIRQQLKNARRELEGPLYRLLAWGVRTFHIFG